MGKRAHGRPCQGQPKSAEKIRELAERARLGLPLFQPGLDAPAGADTHAAVEAERVAGGVAEDELHPGITRVRSYDGRPGVRGRKDRPPPGRRHKEWQVRVWSTRRKKHVNLGRFQTYIEAVQAWAKWQQLYGRGQGQPVSSPTG
jgi:hypothetical protein